MRVWRTVFWDDSAGKMYSWHASAREATKAQAENKRTRTGMAMEVEPIDIPTDKKGLLEWLNSNLEYDNG